MSASHGRYAFEISTWSFFRELIIFPRINQRQRKFDMYLIVSFLFYIKKKEKKVYFFSLFLSDNKLFRPYMVFEFAHQKFVTYISLIIH